MEELRIIRAKEAQTMFGMPKSTFYNRVSDGLMPSSISLGGKAVGWVLSELNAVIKAMIKGKSEDEIKRLVSELKVNRANN
ncbi:MAG: AlpA family phage regulatory protein [Psychromonas sp.]